MCGVVFMYDVIGGGPHDGGTLGFLYPVQCGTVLYLHDADDGIVRIYHTVFCPVRNRVLLYFQREEAVSDREVHGC